MIERAVFVSYCHADAAWLDRVKIHLRPLVRQTGLDLWTIRESRLDKHGTKKSRRRSIARAWLSS